MNRVSDLIFPILAITFALGSGLYGGLGEDTNETRAVMFAFVAVWAATECGSILARTRPGQWDGLTISMVLVRLAVMHYFVSLALQFGGLATFPDSWWDLSRACLGATGALALAFTLRENIRAFRYEMTTRQRLETLATLAAFVTLYTVAGILW